MIFVKCVCIPYPVLTLLRRREKVQALLKARVILKRAAVRVERRAVVAALNAWFPWAKDRIALRSRLKKTIQRWGQLKLVGALELWRENMAEARKVKQLLVRGVVSLFTIIHAVVCIVPVVPVFLISIRDGVCLSRPHPHPHPSILWVYFCDVLFCKWRPCSSARVALRWSGKTLVACFKAWSRTTFEARRLDTNKMARGGELHRAAAIMHRTRARATTRSVLAAWRSAAVRLLETRGRKSATYAAAEAEVEAIAATADLQVAKRELRDALADVDTLRRELQLRHLREQNDDENETMRGEMMALAERIAFERITARDEWAAAEARRDAERAAWERERAATGLRVKQLERLLGAAHGGAVHKLHPVESSSLKPPGFNP
jgi:hypothetical protein